MAINPRTARQRLVLAVRHFRFTANSKYRRRKDNQIGEKDVYKTKLSGNKSFRIQSSQFKFRIQISGVRHDQTGEFLFRILPLLCKRQNQSGTKTFRIQISSRVNLVLVTINFQDVGNGMTTCRLPISQRYYTLNSNFAAAAILIV